MLRKMTKPTRMWIDGKCFNLKPFKTRKKHLQMEPKSKEKDCSPQIMNTFQISRNDEGKLFSSFQLPSWYYIKLNNCPYFSIKNLSDQTKTDISVPKAGKEGNIVVTGTEENHINEAIDEIYSVVGQIRNESKPLQFISIPLLSEPIKEKFEKFKNDILTGEHIDGVEESIFQSSLKLHLTIFVLTLVDQREKDEAVKVLQNYKETILDPHIQKTGPVKIHVGGIDCMQDNYENVHVLYANAKIVDESENNSLQDIVNELSNYFYERGLIAKYQDNVKLHMTLMNTKYRKTLTSPKKRWTKRKSFDATKIMEKYKNYEFGDCNFDNIQLSLISSKGEDGFYKPLSSIKF